MRLPLGIPLVVRHVKIVGPNGSVRVDLLFDTGAAFPGGRSHLSRHTRIGWNAGAAGVELPEALQNRH